MCNFVSVGSVVSEEMFENVDDANTHNGRRTTAYLYASLDPLALVS